MSGKGGVAASARWQGSVVCAVSKIFTVEVVVRESGFILICWIVGMDCA